MPLPHLALAPDAESYTQKDKAEVTSIPVEGGLGRYRRDLLGAARSVGVQWTLNPYQYRYWRAFWQTLLKRGSERFTCDLVPEDGCAPVAHECLVVPGSMGVPSQGGRTYVIGATLEVTPLPVDDAANEAIIEAFTGVPIGVVPHLTLVPDSASYGQSDASDAYAVQLESGASNIRRSKLGMSGQATVQWSMTFDEYRYWRAFWNTAVKRGAKMFTCDLLSEDGDGAVPHKCFFVPDSVTMPSRVGITYVQNATLEVQPLPVDDAYNLQLIDLYETGVQDDVFPALEHLVLVAMPETISA